MMMCNFIFSRIIASLISYLTTIVSLEISTISIIRAGESCAFDARLGIE